MRKVRNGTPDHSVHLCASCSNSRHRKGQAVSQEEWHCDAFEGPVRHQISECNQYSDIQMSNTQNNLFHRTAWVLVPDKKKGLLAIPPEEYRKLQLKGEVY